MSAGDFGSGITLEIDRQVVRIMGFQHVKPGKDAVFVRTRLRDVVNEGVVERTFRPVEGLLQAKTNRIDIQCLYADGNLFSSMNQEACDQVAPDHDIIGGALKFIKGGEIYKVCFYNDNIFSMEPPLFIELEITETEPSFRGDTARGADKSAIIETGATVYIPLFAEIGGKIRIDTGTGEYLSRI